MMASASISPAVRLEAWQRKRLAWEELIKKLEEKRHEFGATKRKREAREIHLANVKRRIEGLHELEAQMNRSGHLLISKSSDS